MPVQPLVDLIQKLRAPGGCPWDRKQTPRSIANYLIEESYELIEAIEAGSTDRILEELGDVLFQVLFIAGVYAQQGVFDLAAVVDENAKKMIRRHPHVFGDAAVSGAEEVKQRWHEIKQRENRRKGQQSLLDSIPAAMPVLLRAFSLCERSARLESAQPSDQVAAGRLMDRCEELAALAHSSSGHSASEGEKSEKVGDALLALVEIARRLQVHPEAALTAAVGRMERRFREVERRLAEEGPHVGEGSGGRLNPE